MNLNTLTWMMPQYVVAKFPARYHSSMVWIGGAGYVFGGATTINPSIQFFYSNPLADLWKVDFAGPNVVATQLHPNGTGPFPRMQHCATALGSDAMLIHGGVTSSQPFGDTAHPARPIPVTTNTWTNVTGPNDSAILRYAHGCTTIPASGTPFRFGGYGPNQSSDIELLSWSNATGWVHVNASGVAPTRTEVDKQITAYEDTLVVADGAKFYYYNSTVNGWVASSASRLAPSSVVTVSGCILILLISIFSN
ncbi:hypothetical protein BDK51DRAFT_32280 [Blyttiomyces helicus]|uniref:Uncharacterized protein n=1 Tax=Blyttiomyces helicus TaxID=388810 RepID=A0A4P9W0J0_9FUNG|nr:hypothetical protein BDK51DRAFT_32280 [Blyttiomyces helicus]|eukprot:RKO85604.1 hypothetical protein BDK51DRAFT_32280 [Blyttiomyces helicus]